jgi:hypothetical protein
VDTLSYSENASLSSVNCTDCDNWLTIPREPDGRPNYGAVPLCRRPYCPCPVRNDSQVTHGLSERRFQAQNFIRKVPRGAVLLTWVVHVWAVLSPAELTRVQDIIRKAVKKVDKDAVVWSFAHWTRHGERNAKFPHLHVGIFSRSPTLILSAADSLSEQVREKGRLVQDPPRGRGRPRTLKCQSFTNPIPLRTPPGVRVEPKELREGGEPAQWIRYVCRTAPKQDKTIVRPPRGAKWVYGVTKGRHKAYGKGERVPVYVQVDDADDWPGREVLAADGLYILSA